MDKVHFAKLAYSRFVLAAAFLALAFAAPANASGPSAFCHTVDGTFTACPGAEWSDITPDVFLNGGSFVYADQDDPPPPGPGQPPTTLYLMYDYLLGSCPLGPTDCGVVEFDVEELSKTDHYAVQIGNCAVDGFDVFVNNVKLPERLEEDIEAAAGCTTSPNSGTAHQMYELSVPLVLVYQPDDPRFWSSNFPAPPLVPTDDFDGDGVLNATDNCPFAANIAQEDSNANGRGDACDGCPGGDADFDGIPDATDNCKQIPNAQQIDRDADGHGDKGCDACKDGPDAACPGHLHDGDHDGVGDTTDNCPKTKAPNALQEDADGDGFGDVCDPCLHDPTNSCADIPQCRNCFPDTDGDGVFDNDDNCPNAANPAQDDGDADEVGDVCDSCPTDPGDCGALAEQDGDSDGLVNEDDNCAAIANSGQEDADLDGFGDACDACPADADNQCVPCQGGSGLPLARSPRGPGAGDVQAHGSILTANSTGTTDSRPLANCSSVEACAGADPKVLLKFVKKKLSTLVKCAKAGTNPCDLSDVNEIGPLTVGCRAVAECGVDAALEVMLGTNSPPVSPVTDDCAYAIANNGAKFVRKMVQNHTKNRDDLTPGAAATGKGKIAGKCPDPITAPANLGGDCTGQTARTAALDCLYRVLERSLPLP